LASLETVATNYFMMSTENEAVADADEVCASCGKAEVDDVKLKKCACNLVKYCSVGCQKNHRPQHKKICKKRLAEIRDDKLLKQPDSSYLGDCPICCLPLSIELKKSSLMSCCSKYICKGCSYTNQKREFEAGLEQKCPFCREPVSKSKEESEKKRMERVKKNDPAAMWYMGMMRLDEGDYDGALEYWTKAAGLGDADAHYNLSGMYYKGKGAEKDEKKQVYHLEEAAIAGHPTARHNLGIVEYENGSYERAKKHFIIAANLGYNDSLKNVKALYAEGHASKEDYANALCAYQAAVDATKSLEREKAEEAIKKGVLKNC
jgi:hypothetical protein